MSCKEVKEWLYLHPDGELGPAEDQRLQTHLATCEACRELQTEVADIVRDLGAEPAPAAPPGFRSRLEARLREEPVRSTAGLRRWLPLAAAAALVVLLGSWWLQSGSRVPAEEQLAAAPAERRAGTRADAGRAGERSLDADRQEPADEIAMLQDRRMAPQPIAEAEAEADLLEEKLGAATEDAPLAEALPAAPGPASLPGKDDQLAVIRVEGDVTALVALLDQAIAAREQRRDGSLDSKLARNESRAAGDSEEQRAKKEASEPLRKEAGRRSTPLGSAAEVAREVELSFAELTALLQSLEQAGAAVKWPPDATAGFLGGRKRTATAAAERQRVRIIFVTPAGEE